MVNKKSPPKERKLSPKEELFCQYYAKSGIAFSNARKSYALAFDKDFTNEKQKDVCDSLSFRLLSKVKINKRCEQLLSQKINDEIADTELGYVIQQRENLHAKVSALSEYNKVRGRITERHKLETPLIIQVVQEIADKNGIKNTNASAK